MKGPGQFVGDNVQYRTMGVIGMGNIGARVADICKLAFQMRVLVHDPFLSDEEIAERGGEPCTLDELMQESDYITLHVPLSEQNPGDDRRAGVQPDEAHRVLHQHLARAQHR